MGKIPDTIRVTLATGIWVGGQADSIMKEVGIQNTCSGKTKKIITHIYS